MYESFRDDKRHSKGRKQTPVLLLLEELESRCLLSTGLQVSNHLLTSAPVAEREAGAVSSIGVISLGVLGVLDVLDETPLVPGSTAPSPLISSISTAANGGICVGPDGSVWLQEWGQVGQLNPTTGVIRQFNLPPGTDWELNITIGPDGNLWLPRGSHIDELNPSTGIVQEFSLPLGQSTAYGSVIGLGSDGNIWFTYWERGGFGISYGEINPRTGVINEGIGLNGDRWNRPNGFSTLPDGFSTRFINWSVGADGKIWFIEFDPRAASAYLGQFEPSSGLAKTIAQFPAGWPTGIAATPDGRLWFPESNIKRIDEFDPTTGKFEFFGMGSPTLAPPSGSTSTSNDSISASGTSLSVTAGNDFVGAVATFAPQTSIASPGAAYQTTIDWGDGTASSFVFTVTDNATYDVTAEHTYQTAGTYSIKVNIGNYNPSNPLGDNVVTVFSTANVDPVDIAMWW